MPTNNPDGEVDLEAWFQRFMSGNKGWMVFHYSFTPPQDLIFQVVGLVPSDNGPVVELSHVSEMFSVSSPDATTGQLPTEFTGDDGTFPGTIPLATLHQLVVTERRVMNFQELKLPR